MTSDPNTSNDRNHSTPDSMSEAAEHEAVETSVAPLQATERRRRRKLVNFSLLILAGVVAYYIVAAEVRDPQHLLQGLAILALGALPSIQWARSKNAALPVFEIFAFTGINTYAIPLLNGHQQLQRYELDVITKAGWVVLVYQCVLILSFNTVSGHPGTSHFFSREIIDRKVRPYIGYGLWLTTIYIGLESFTNLIPGDLVSVLRAVFYGLGMACAFVASHEWGKGNLHPRDRAVFLINLILQFVLQISSLMMVGGISLAVLALIGYVSGSKKIPLIPLAVLIVLIALLHNGKSEMRNRYWDMEGFQKTPLTIGNLPGFFIEWLSEGFKSHTKDSVEGGRPEIAGKLLERSSLFHMLCLVVDNSPERQPFLDGETYLDIPGQFVPRIFWPEKPRGHVSTYRLATYYGIQRIEDTQRTTVGFGMLPEAYANFGFLGAIVLGALMGAFYKKIHILTRNSPLLSYGGLGLIVLMAWSYQTEMTMSIWITSMWQALVAVIGLPMILARLFH